MRALLMICSVLLLAEYGYAINCWGYNTPDGLENRFEVNCGVGTYENHNGELCAKFRTLTSNLYGGCLGNNHDYEIDDSKFLHPIDFVPDYKVGCFPTKTPEASGWNEGWTV